MEESYINKEIKQEISNVISNLEEIEQQIINMKFYEQYQDNEIYTELNIDEETYNTILNNLLEKLRKNKQMIKLNNAN